MNNPLIKEDNNPSIIIDSAFRETVEKNIQLNPTGYFSSFKTQLEARYYKNGIVVDSIIENHYNIDSWYSIRSDSIDLVAHIGELESVALLIHFVHGKASVWFFRAGHGLTSNYFKINKGDSLKSQIEVTPLRYKLELSEIPDTLHRQIVYGHIDMDGGEYYDSRDSTDQKQRVSMKFYFRSQYKKFDFQK